MCLLVLKSPKVSNLADSTLIFPSPNRIVSYKSFLLSPTKHRKIANFVCSFYPCMHRNQKWTEITAKTLPLSMEIPSPIGSSTKYLSKLLDDQHSTTLLTPCLARCSHIRIITQICACALTQHLITYYPNTLLHIGYS